MQPCELRIRSGRASLLGIDGIFKFLFFFFLLYFWLGAGENAHEKESWTQKRAVNAEENSHPIKRQRQSKLTVNLTTC
jgi:hypothetical protein